MGGVMSLVPFTRRIVTNRARDRAAGGEPVEADTRINFADAKTMFTMLNGNRFDVLTFVADNHPKSINAIATGLGRGYRRVHEDVQALLNLGLIDRQDDGSLSVGFNPETLSVEVAA
jgi:predicted transcriptional regulator